VYVGQRHLLEKYLPSLEGLSVSEWLIYDLLGSVYYRIRGWV
jgi:hypothetical protein